MNKKVISKTPTKKKTKSSAYAIKQPKNPKAINYLSNAELLRCYAESRKIDRITEEFGTKLLMLANKYVKKANFAGYSYTDDMVSYALMQVCNTWRSFNPERSNNPFAFYTQCIKNGFIQFLNQEKKQRNIRDQEIMFAGGSTSFNFTDNRDHSPDDEQEPVIIESNESYDD